MLPEVHDAPESGTMPGCVPDADDAPGKWQHFLGEALKWSTQALYFFLFSHHVRLLGHLSFLISSP